MGQIINEIGHRYGLLTVIRQATVEERKNRKSRRIQWICECDCGNIVMVDGSDLRSGNQKSCGCLKRQNIITKNINNYRDLSNQKFGKLLVLYPLSNRADGGNYIWHCKCDCGNECDVIGSRLTRHTTTSCGCAYTRRKSQFSIAINNILQDNDFNYKEEYYIKYNDGSFGFIDFYLIDYNIAIEVQGKQHYDKTSSWYRPNSDEKKRQWCQEHNIKLVEIPYWDLDKYSLDYIVNKIGVTK